jgi:ATP-binding cassette subfamily B protein
MGFILATGGKMIVMALLGLALGIGGGYFGSQASAGLARNLREAMFVRIQDFSFANIDHFSTSGLVTRLTTDVTNIQNAYMMLLRMAMRAPISLVTAMFMSFVISPRIASIYLAAVVFLSIVLILIMNRATRYFKQVFERYDDLNQSVQENVTAIRVVKAFVREEH